MAHARATLDTYPGTFDFDSGELAEAIEALISCATTCTQCADICGATARVVSRQTEYDDDVTRAMLLACIAVCSACAAECGQHGPHMEHCRICAEACQRCEQACRTLLQAASA